MQETKREKEVNNCLDYLRDILDAEYSDLVSFEFSISNTSFATFLLHINGQII